MRLVQTWRKKIIENVQLSSNQLCLSFFSPFSTKYDVIYSLHNFTPVFQIGSPGVLGFICTLYFDLLFQLSQIPCCMVIVVLILIFLYIYLHFHCFRFEADERRHDKE